MRSIVRTSLAVIVGLVVINVLITAWAFIAVSAIWPELAPRPDGTMPFPPGDHPAFLVEMVVNVPVAVLAAYLCARIAGRREALHVTVLGAVLLTLSAAYAVGAAGAEFGAAKPLWAHAGTAVGLVIGLACGLWLSLRRHPRAVSRGVE